MEVLYEVRGDNLFIYLPEELDHHNAKIITEQSDWYIISNQIKNIVFNFSEYEFYGQFRCWRNYGQIQAYKAKRGQRYGN